jgi:hypothetical protein
MREGNTNRANAPQIRSAIAINSSRAGLVSCGTPHCEARQAIAQDALPTSRQSLLCLVDPDQLPAARPETRVTAAGETERHDRPPRGRRYVASCVALTRSSRANGGGPSVAPPIVERDGVWSVLVGVKERGHMPAAETHAAHEGSPLKGTAPRLASHSFSGAIARSRCNVDDMPKPHACAAEREVPATCGLSTLCPGSRSLASRRQLEILL